MATNPVSVSPSINLQQERMNMRSTIETELFSDRVKMFHLWPGGNDTYICIAPTQKRHDYIAANRAILSQYSFMEQGGFVEKPTDAVVGRLQMAGGEFCGNATRSLGALIASDYFGKQEIAGSFDYSKIHKYDQNNIIFEVETSGTLEKPRLQVTKINDDYNVSVVLNLIKNLDQVTNKLFQYRGKNIPVSVVKMDGITHVLVSEKELAFSPDPDEYRSRIDNLLNQLDLTKEAAVGLITYNKEGANVVIDPVVWVAAVSTCFYETSCCSGSIALATSLWGTQDRDTMKVEIIQPSKIPLTIEITGSRINRGINKIDASGIVKVKGNLNDSGQLSKI